MPFEPIETTVAYRPTTSNAFRVPFNLSDPVGSSHYDDAFTSKFTGKAEPIRTGTASGTRSNNPHPSNVRFFILSIRFSIFSSSLNISTIRILWYFDFDLINFPRTQIVIGPNQSATNF